MTRRDFGLSFSGLTLLDSSVAAPAAARAPWDEPAIVKKVYLAVTKPTWPYPAIDVAKERAEIETSLAALERAHPGEARLVDGGVLRTAGDAKAFVAALGDVDAVLIIDLTSQTDEMLRILRDIPQPVLLYARPYSGWSYVSVANWAQKGKKADLVSTSDPGDLAPYLRMFRTIRHMRRSRVLVVNGSARHAAAAGFTTHFGTAIDYASYADLKAAYESIDGRQALQAADEFTRGALRVVEPKPEEIADALRFALGVERLLRAANANAITIDCLGGFRRGDLPAYPCVAWSRLNDVGMYGVCEADLHSTMTQLLLTPLTGKPGFVTDPVFDTSRNEIIHAHCVSATTLNGIGGAKCPYIIRSHMEDNKGVSMQVLVPAGETVTVGKFLDPTSFVVSTGEVIGNVDFERGCRTKFRTRVEDAQQFLDGFAGGLHRVVFWGDWRRTLQRMGRLMGFQITQEG